MAVGRQGSMLDESTRRVACEQPRPGLDDVRADERRRLCDHVRSVIVPGLEGLVDPAAPAADLVARAGVHAGRLRAALERPEPVGELLSSDAVAGRARDDEREWVRGHLHDTALQILEFIAGDGFATGLSATKISHLAGGAAEDLRRWVDGLEEPAAAELLPALEQVAAEARSLHYGVHLVVGELGVPPSDEQISALAGAAREAVTNARKHARASRVTIRVASAGDGRTAVTVTDDGIGFDAQRAADGSGLGVRRSIVGRMRRAGGGASIEDAPGGGTRVTLLTSCDGSLP
jgi:anti-sigma regulatory factor (Ser/Thr protein kinase)